MKVTFSFVLCVGFTSLGYSQEEPSKKWAPMKMLPKEGEVKQIFELSVSSEYELFDGFGNFISRGEGQFIDYTNLKKGSYFVRYNGKTEKFEKK